MSRHSHVGSAGGTTAAALEPVFACVCVYIIYIYIYVYNIINIYICTHSSAREASREKRVSRHIYIHIYIYK